MLYFWKALGTRTTVALLPDVTHTNTGRQRQIQERKQRNFEIGQVWGRSPQICTVYLCVTLKNKIINPCSKANSLITRLVYVPTATKTILGHLPDLL